MMEDQWRKVKSRLVTKALECLPEKLIFSCVSMTMPLRAGHPQVGSNSWSVCPDKSFFFFLILGLVATPLCWCIRKKCLSFITTTTCSGRQFLLNRKSSVLLRVLDLQVLENAEFPRLSKTKEGHEGKGGKDTKKGVSETLKLGHRQAKGSVRNSQWQNVSKEF